MEIVHVTRHRLGDTYLMRNHDGTIFEGYVSGDYVQANDTLRADRYGDKGFIPLEHKAVIKLSVMSGCPFKCRPCDAGLAGYNGNATTQDLIDQFETMLADTGLETCQKTKLHVSKLGEPSLNWANTDAAIRSIVADHPELNPLPTITTLPRTAQAARELTTSVFNYPTLSQIKINAGSTSETDRRQLYGATTPLPEIISILQGSWKNRTQDHRITLTFLAVPDTEFSAEQIIAMTPEEFRSAVTIEMYKVNPTINATRFGYPGLMRHYKDSHRYETQMAALREAGFGTYYSAPSDGEQRAHVANGSSLHVEQQTAAPSTAI